MAIACLVFVGREMENYGVGLWMKVWLTGWNPKQEHSTLQHFAASPTCKIILSATIVSHTFQRPMVLCSKKAETTWVQQLRHPVCQHAGLSGL